jgi:hypothetical protein
MGTMDCTLYVWGPGSSVPWDAAYWKDTRLQMPSSLVDLELLGGFRHRVLRPFESYRLSYVDERQYGGTFAFDLDFRGLRPPAYFGAKHFDQPMHVTGTLMVDGIEHQVDCQAMRDRSWYRRGDYTHFRSAYSYGIVSPDEGFLALYAAPRGEDLLRDNLPLVGGHLLAVDEEPLLVRGQRRVTSRDPATGQPWTVEISYSTGGTDRTVVGTVRNAIALAANTNMMSWMSLVDWQLDGATVVGEDQEIWSPGIWRAFRKGADPA